MGSVPFVNFYQLPKMYEGCTKEVRRMRMGYVTSEPHGSEAADGGWPSTLRSGVLTRKSAEYVRECRHRLGMNEG